MEHIIIEVSVFYLKVWAIYMTYFFSKYYAAEYGFFKMSAVKKLIRCAIIFAVLFVIAAIASCDLKSNGEDSPTHVVAEHPSRGAIVFIALLIPILFGFAEGKDQKTKEVLGSRTLKKIKDLVNKSDDKEISNN
jgi:hypothetical protein